MKNLRIALVFASLGLVACGTSDDGGGGGTSGGGSVSADEAGPRVAEVVCERLAGCCDLAEYAAVGISDVASCETVLGVLFSSSEADYADAIARGTMVYDGRAAATCIRSLDNRTDCASDLFDGAPECEQVWQGLVADGAECLFDEECTSGLCSFADESAATGLCAVPTEGGPCALSCFDDEGDGERFCYNTCGGELTCSTTFEGGADPVSQCVRETIVGEGEACVMGNTECAEGFWCDFDADACVATRADGATCENDRECTSDSCQGGVCEAASVCTSLF